jgi:hypothetical protein
MDRVFSYTYRMPFSKARTRYRIASVNNRDMRNNIRLTACPGTLFLAFFLSFLALVDLLA